MATQARQAKVLCIRIIQGKNVLDKTIDLGASVTVGKSAKNTFVLPDAKLGQSEFQLFKAVGNGYVLRFTKDMRGKVEARGAVIKLQQLYGDSSVTKQAGIAQVPLTEQDRGKLTVDGATILFQFLPPPPAQALKPIQQMDFRPRLMSDDDPMFLGFLAIWAALASVLVVYVWNTEPHEYSLEEVPDRFARIIMEPPPKPVVDEPTEPEEPEELEQTGTVVEVPDDDPDQTVAEVEKPPEPTETEVERVQRQEERKEDIVAESALLKILATTGESTAGVVQNLWTPEEQGLGDIDAALAEKTVEATVKTTGPRNTADKGGTAAVDVEVQSVGGGGAATADVSGPAVTVKPKVRAETGSIDVSGDEGAVKGVVRRYTGQLTYCYEKRLKAVPSLEGRIEVGWSVSGGGVSGAPYIIFNGTGDAELADCITKKIRRWRFPDDVEGELSWPFAFQAKK